MNISGIVLAGGKSSRMKEDKGLMLLNGKPMISYTIDALKGLCQEVIIIANGPSYSKFGLSVYEDLYQDKGPLAGIYTGLYYSRNRINIVLSCDVPMVSKDLLLHLMDKAAQFDVTVPLHKEGTEQLMGVYSKACLRVFKEQIDNGRLKIKDANQLMKYQEVPIDESHSFYDPKIFMNVNTPADFEAIGDSDVN